MKKILKVLTMTMICIAMALIVSCKKNDPEPSTGDSTLSGGTGYIAGHEYVDLGLPSGLLWATCNLGADNPEDYGEYFAWGETTTKDKFTMSTYKWCDDNYKFTKYNTVPFYGVVDNKTSLESDDDAASSNWGDSWRMPTCDEMKELRNQCSWEWTAQDGVNGYKVIGPNGFSIFFPAAGYYSRELKEAGTKGNYWSKTVNATSCYAECFDLDANSCIVEGVSHYRYDGLTVRPVSVRHK